MPHGPVAQWIERLASNWQICCCWVVTKRLRVRKHLRRRKFAGAIAVNPSGPVVRIWVAPAPSWCFFFFSLRQQMRYSLRGKQSRAGKFPSFAKGKALLSFPSQQASFARLRLTLISRRDSLLLLQAPTPSSVARRQGQFLCRLLRAQAQARFPAGKTFSLWREWQSFSFSRFSLLRKFSSSRKQYSQNHLPAGA